VACDDGQGDVAAADAPHVIIGWESVMPQTAAPPRHLGNQSTLSMLCFPRSRAPHGAEHKSSERGTGADSGAGLRAWVASSPQQCREACDEEALCRSWSFEPIAACRHWACGDFILPSLEKERGQVRMDDAAGDERHQGAYLCVLLDSFQPARYLPGSWAGHCQSVCASVNVPVSVLLLMSPCARACAYALQIGKECTPDTWHRVHTR
jgi:hypothetical protein